VRTQADDMGRPAFGPGRRRRRGSALARTREAAGWRRVLEYPVHRVNSSAVLGVGTGEGGLEAILQIHGYRRGFVTLKAPRNQLTGGPVDRQLRRLVQMMSPTRRCGRIIRPVDIDGLARTTQVRPMPGGDHRACEVFRPRLVRTPSGAYDRGSWIGSRRTGSPTSRRPDGATAECESNTARATGAPGEAASPGWRAGGGGGLSKMREHTALAS